MPQHLRQLIVSKTIGLPFVRSRDRQTSCLKDYCFQWHNQSYPSAQIPVDSFDNCIVNLVDRAGGNIGTKTAIPFVKIREVANDGQEYIQIDSTQLAAPIAPGKYDIEIECDGELVCVSEKIHFCDYSNDCLCDIPRFKVSSCGEIFPCCELFRSILLTNPIIITINQTEAPFSVKADLRDLLEALEQFDSSITDSFNFKDKDGNFLGGNSNLGVVTLPLPDENLFPISFCMDSSATIECDGQTDQVNFVLEYPINYSAQNEEFLVGFVDSCTGDFSTAGVALTACDFVASDSISQGTFAVGEVGDAGFFVQQGNSVVIPSLLFDNTNSLIINRTTVTSCNGLTNKLYRLDWDEDDICGTLQITEL